MKRIAANMALSTALAAALLALSGCIGAPSAGNARLEALGGTPLVLEPSFVASAATRRDTEHSFWFSTVPLSALADLPASAPVPDAVFVHIQMVWTPAPGLTPLDDTAMNAVVRTVVVSGGEIGIYGGGAFVRPTGLDEDESTTGEPTTWSLEIEGGSVSLLEKTAGFSDLLSPAGFAGSFKAERNQAGADAWRRAVSQIATNRFGRSMWVSADRAAHRSAALR
ncbi:MAG: hypothetical protein ACKOYN_12005 [Planctomycetota bacterium]